ncbi:hypothetical protein AB7W80_09430 [Providencia rettgeri]
MTLDTKVNNQASIFININNKVIPYKKTSVIDNLNIIKPLSSESYNKINFAIQNSEFHESAQPVLNQLPYSPPVEKLLLPYTYHEDDLVSSLDIFKNSIEIKNDSLISEKKDTELMLLNKISTTETKVFKDFRLNRSAGRFSNLILEIKSTHEKGIRYLKNILKKNNNEELCVKFENGEAKITDKATIARQELMKQHKEINHTEKENSAIDLEWDYFEQEPTYLDNRSAVFPHQKNESLNFESNNTDEFNDLITVLYSSDESLNSSGYHSDTSLPLRSSEYSSTESLHQENDNLNPNIDLIINNPTKYYNLTNFNSNNEILKYSSSESLHQKKYNKENFSDINKRPEKQTQTEKMKLLTEGKSSTGYIHPSRRNKINNSNQIEKINQLDRKIAELEAQKKEYQEMANITSTHEKKIKQLVLEAKQDIVENKNI